jgi:hypothetical protein
MLLNCSAQLVPRLEESGEGTSTTKFDCMEGLRHRRSPIVWTRLSARLRYYEN